MATYAKEPYPIEPEVADALLKKLASDDDFRAAFLKDHFAAIKSLGHQPPRDRPDGPGCSCADTLAPKEEIAAAHQRLLAEFSKSMVFHQDMLVSPVGRKATSRY